MFDLSDNNNNNNMLVLVPYATTISRLNIHLPFRTRHHSGIHFVVCSSAACRCVCCCCCCCCSSPIIILGMMIKSEIPLCPPFRTGPVRFRSSLPHSIARPPTAPPLLPASVGSYSTPPPFVSGNRSVSPVGDLHNNTQHCFLSPPRFPLLKK